MKEFLSVSLVVCLTLVVLAPNVEAARPFLRSKRSISMKKKSSKALSIKMKVATKKNLKKLFKNKKPFNTKLKGIQSTAQSHPAYKTDKGVVVTAAHPTDAATHSYLQIHHVDWGPTALKNISKDLPFTQNIPKGGNRQVAFGFFRRISSKQHVYALAIGTTIPKKDLIVSVNAQEIPMDHFQFVAGYNHYVALITAASRPQHRTLAVAVRTNSPASGPRNFQKFHHIQLIQYD
mgnify:CR=1 FL=1